MQIFKRVSHQLLSILLMGLSTYATSASVGLPPGAIDKDGLRVPIIPLYSYVVSLSVGPVWEGAGISQIIFLQPDIEKRYIGHNGMHALVDGELFLGIQRLLGDNFEGQAGLALATTSNAPLNGIIWDDADPRFNNFSYGYNIFHSHVAAKAKLLTNMYWVKPYVSGSIGVGFNRASSYKSQPLIPEAVPTPDFTAYTSTAFTYTFGLGIQRDFSRNWQVGIGYELADWGQSRLGRAPGQTLGHGLSLNHLYTNGVMFNLTYLS